MAKSRLKVFDHCAIFLLVAGGVTYTTGTVFYMSRKIPYAHGIWHLFVLGGSAFHFIAVLDVVLRGAPLSG